MKEELDNLRSRLEMIEQKLTQKEGRRRKGEEEENEIRKIVMRIGKSLESEKREREKEKEYNNKKK